MSDKPTNLYSWAVATPLYAWTQDGVTYYTYTSTVQYKDHLYDANGVDTGEKVGTIYQDGSWDLYIPGYSTVTLTIGYDEFSTHSSFYLNGTLETISGSSQQFTVPKDQPCTIELNDGLVKGPSYIKYNGTIVADGASNISYTFTASDDANILLYYD